MMRPHALISGKKKLVRVLPGASKSIQSAFLQHAAGTATFTDHIKYPVIHFLHQVAFFDQVSVADDWTKGRHNLGIGIGHCYKHVQ